jgi:hypothetical protein
MRMKNPQGVSYMRVFAWVSNEAPEEIVDLLKHELAIALVPVNGDPIEIGVRQRHQRDLLGLAGT